MISDGEFKSGDSLPPQKELASQFGVGISTIREAIQALVAMGVVESRPGKGTWIRGTSPHTLRGSVVRAVLGDIKAEQLFETRWVVEVALAELAARRASNEDIEMIWQAQRDMRAALESDTHDVPAYAEADLRFHLAVTKAAKNQLLEEFYGLIQEMLSEALKAMDEISEVRVMGVVIQDKIAKAIAQHDAVGARLAAMELLEYVAPHFFDQQPIENTDKEQFVRVFYP